MARRYEDPVHVRLDAPDGTPGTEPPSSFLWRGRLYVVRAVLGHWRERRAWWTESAARAVHGDDVAPRGASAPAAHDPASDPASGSAALSVRPTLADEREVWRVEAGCGRTAGLGVYDLCHDPDRAWSLVQVSD